MNLGLPEMIFIFLMALIIFGPKKLPEIGRQIGRALNEFKRASNEFKSQIESEISNLDIPDTKFDLRDLTNKILPPSELPQARVTITPAQPEAVPPSEPPVPPSPDFTNVAKAPDA
jgi:TatA/E family protein of Tat protein translocase